MNGTVPTESAVRAYLDAALSGDLYMNPECKLRAAAAVLQHEDATRLAEALERIANALDNRGGI